MEKNGETVSFNALEDKDIYLIKDENGALLAEIKGYNLEIIFNLDNISTTDDTEATSSGIALMFKELIVQQLIDSKK